MSKTLKFSTELVKLIQNGIKTTTWRLFDDKNIQVDDKLTLIKRPELTPFAEALVTNVNTKELKDLTEEDKEGHEDVGTTEKMYKTYSEYYNQQLTPETEVKIIKFKILRFI